MKHPQFSSPEAVKQYMIAVINTLGDFDRIVVKKLKSDFAGVEVISYECILTPVQKK